MSYFVGRDEHELSAVRQHLLSDFEAFSKFAFKIQTGADFISVDYHSVMFKAIQQLIDLKSNRMIITIPPRAGKTQIISIFLPLFAWCHNAHGQSILTGFNSSVLFESSGYVRSIMSDPDFQAVFPDVVIDINKKSIERLGTMSGGVLNAVVTSGKVTGIGCGTLAEGFSGLMCIDDVIKPSDAQSPVERNKINDRFSNTLLSRLATETTPLVVIMQRLHSEDLAGVLMKGNTSETYDWLNIPGIITKETGSQEWYDKQIEEFGYTSVNPVLYNLERPDELFDESGESSFWPIRKSIKTLQGMREKDPYTFYSQYMGMPVSKGKETVTHDDIRTYEELDPKQVRYTFMTSDTASTTKDYSDYTVACLWAVMNNADLYLVDVIIGKWSVPDLIVEIRNFWKKHNRFDMHRPTMLPRAFYIEDKSSGLFLNQQFLKDGSVTVRPVPRDGTAANKKFDRFLNTVPYFRQQRIYLPQNSEHIGHMRRELTGQTEYGNQTGHDDFVDNVSDAVTVAFSVKKTNYQDWYD